MSSAIDQCISEIRESVASSASEVEMAEVIERILGTVLQALEEKQRTVTPADIHRPLLSLQAQKILRQAVKVVFVVRVAPCFLPGIGASFNEGSLPLIDPATAFRTTSLLCNMALGHRELFSVILPPLVGDIFAILVQLAYNTERPPTKEMRIACLGYISKLMEALGAPDTMQALFGLLVPRETPPPAWFKKRVGSLLSACLTEDGGVAALLGTVSGTIVDENSPDMQRVLSILTSFPPQVPQEEYFELLAKQLRHLLSLSNQTNLVFSSAQAAVALIGTYPELGAKYIICPILDPLRKVGQKRTAVPDTSEEIVVDVDERTVAQCLVTLHQLLVGCGASNAVLSSVREVIPALFRLYCYTSKARSNLKATCEQVLLIFFKLCDDACDVILSLVLPPSPEIDDRLSDSEEEENTPLVEEVLDFAPGGSGGVVIRWVESKERDWQFEATCLVAVLALLKRDKLSGELFVALLREFTVLRSRPDLEDYILRHELLLNTLSAMAETLGPSVVNEPKQILSFLNSTLHSEDTETLEVSIAMLAALLGGANDVKLDAETRLGLLQFLPLLQHLATHTDEKIAQTAVSLQTIILALDPSWKQTAESGTLPVLEGRSIDLNALMGEFRDALPPVRAHALVTLRKLVEKRDPTVMKATDKIIDTFHHVVPEETIPVLAASYLNERERDENRLKVGEVLVKVASKLGEAFGHHSNTYFNIYFRGARSDSVPVRASSLSNLATACGLMKYSLPSMIYEVLGCLITMLRSDPEAEVRRAAAYALSQIIVGMGDEAIHTIPDVVQEIYRELKHVATADIDTVTRFHAKRGLGEIDKMMRLFIFPDTSEPKLKWNLPFQTL